VPCGFTPRSLRGVAAGAEPEVWIRLPPGKCPLRTWPQTTGPARTPRCPRDKAVDVREMGEQLIVAKAGKMPAECGYGGGTSVKTPDRGRR